MKKAKKIFPVFVIVLLFFPFAAMPQTVFKVKDAKHREQSKVLMNVEKATTFLKIRLMPVVTAIKNVQEFTSKTVSIVSGVVKNMKMVKRLIEIEKEIQDLVESAIIAINQPRDTDGDGEDDLDFLDKWKHIQVLLAIAGQADNLFDLFKNVIEQDATVMDDKGRLTLIKDAYRDAVKIKLGIYMQLRRMNREIYRYRRGKKEIDFFAKMMKPL